MPRARKPRLGRPPGDPDTVAGQWTLRSAPGDLAAIEHAAAAAGLPRGTWAAQKLAELAAGPTPPRFATLDAVLRYVAELDAEGRDAFIDLAVAPLLDDPQLLRAAIALAWAAERGALVAGACEAHAERSAEG